ncbi:polysaccharide pyruvyl transferase family protein [Agitococcus lubricus]|uniref:Polysaccharide pyruvyl transferase n=1 Tax=Agitococcus lubricus TaxID=1077255 RepID=A0A2T5J3E2_9GAMM|nr:polysaccharide pyruvyl transferase family protein [Agitococcus lubricus]PTQ91096.1 polysaccharide pyruvyl transferase [Agitococcus lubricus]
MSRQTTVVMSLAAQEDNLGDIEIRSVLLTWLQASNNELLLYRGTMSDSYINAYPLKGKYRLFLSYFALQLALLMAFFSGKRIVFCIAPGPQIVSASWRARLRDLLAFINIKIARLSGGRAIIVGRSYRGNPAHARLIQAYARQADILTFRDDISSPVLNGLGEVSPDLGFFAQQQGTKDRDLAVLVLREAQFISSDIFSNFVAAARAEGLKPTVVVQVHRDNKLAQELATKYGMDLVDWGQETHHQQTEKVEAIYARTAIIISNRLHGLIMGVRIGAIPFTLTSSKDTKLVPTMRVVMSNCRPIDLEQMSTISVSDWRSRIQDAISPESCDLVQQDLYRARQRLHDLELRVEGLVKD